MKLQRLTYLVLLWLLSYFITPYCFEPHTEAASKSVAFIAALSILSHAELSSHADLQVFFAMLT